MENEEQDKKYEVIKQDKMEITPNEEKNISNTPIITTTTNPSILKSSLDQHFSNLKMERPVEEIEKETHWSKDLESESPPPKARFGALRSSREVGGKILNVNNNSHESDGFTPVISMPIPTINTSQDEIHFHFERSSSSSSSSSNLLSTSYSPTNRSPNRSPNPTLRSPRRSVSPGRSPSSDHLESSFLYYVADLSIDQDIENQQKSQDPQQYSIVLSGRGISDLNESTTLFTLKQIVNLHLEHNELIDLPPELGTLINLKELDLAFNKLISVPVEIGYLKHLSKLTLNYNRLTVLPKQLGQLVYLTDLNVNFNMLTMLPQEIGKLTNLMSLKCSGNHIVEIPQEVVWMTSLREMYLDDNRIENLPSGMGELRLRSLILHNNPMNPQLKEAYSGGLSCIFTHLQSLEQEVLVSPSTFQYDMSTLLNSKLFSDFQITIHNTHNFVTHGHTHGHGHHGSHGRDDHHHYNQHLSVNQNPLHPHSHQHPPVKTVNHGPIIRTIPCHKVILRFGLPSSIQSTLIKCETSNELDFNNQNIVVFFKILHFLYCGYVDIYTEDKRLAPEILLTASKLKMEDLIEICSEKLGKDSVSNYLKSMDTTTKDSQLLNVHPQFSIQPEFPVSTSLFKKMNLKGAVNNPLYSDVVFVIGEKRVYCHRCILVSRSSYFQSMFLGGFTESEKSEIRIDDMGYDIFFALVEYMYNDETEVSGENAVEIMIAANIYGIERLKQICEKIVSEGVEDDNVLSIFEISDLYRCISLKNRCKYYVIKNFDRVIQLPDWKTFRQDLKNEVEEKKKILADIAANRPTSNGDVPLRRKFLKAKRK